MMNKAHTYYTHARIFTGKEWIENGTVETSDGKIIAVNVDPAASDNQKIDCNNNLLVPAFIDLQVYGAGGKLLASYPEANSLKILARENRKGGVAVCLATIATQPMENIYACLKAIRDYWQMGGTGIIGMHLEGPFIHPAKRGAHIAKWMHAPTMQEVKDLLAFADGVIKVVTLAPEICEPAIVALFVDAGVKVFAGHSNASYDEAMQFPGLGINTVTHLFNAMSPLHHRDTGIPGAAFENNLLHASIIPDGIHVSYAALRIAKKQMQERLFFITDSVTETSVGDYQHHLNNDRYCMPDGTLSGSAISMLQGVKNAVQYAGIHLDEALRMAGLYPAHVLQITNDYGTIAVGKKASFLLLNENLELVDMIDG